MIIVKAKKALRSKALKNISIIKKSKLYKTISTIPVQFLAGRNGFGMNELLGVAAGIIIAAIVVTGLKSFVVGIVDSLAGWWESIENIFFSNNISTE